MPLFSYLCKSCNKEHEILVRGRERPACPACGSTDLVKQMSAPTPLSLSAASHSHPAPSEACASCCGAPGGECPYN